MNEMRKSYRLSRYHCGIVLILILILIGLFLRFFELIQASIEEVSMEVNLLNMQQMLHYQNLLSKSKDPQCTFLDKPDLFQQFSADVPDSSVDKATPGSWHYDSIKHQLIYHVRSKHYFRSEFKQKIIIVLYCNHGVISFKQSSFKWCRDKTILGCRSW